MFFKHDNFKYYGPQNWPKSSGIWSPHILELSSLGGQPRVIMPHNAKGLAFLGSTIQIPGNYIFPFLGLLLLVKLKAKGCKREDRKKSHSLWPALIYNNGSLRVPALILVCLTWKKSQISAPPNILITLHNDK